MMPMTPMTNAEMDALMADATERNCERCTEWFPAEDVNADGVCFECEDDLNARFTDEF